MGLTQSLLQHCWDVSDAMTERPVYPQSAKGIRNSDWRDGNSLAHPWEYVERPLKGADFRVSS